MAPTILCCPPSLLFQKCLLSLCLQPWGAEGLGDLLGDEPGLVLVESQAKLSKLCLCPHPMMSMSPCAGVGGVGRGGHRWVSQGARTSPSQNQAWVSRHSSERLAFPGDRGAFPRRTAQLTEVSTTQSLPAGVQPQSRAGHRGGAARPQEWDPDPSGPSHRGAPRASHGRRTGVLAPGDKGRAGRALCQASPWGVGAESSLNPQEACPPRPRKPARHSGCHTSGTSDARTSAAPWWSQHRTGPGPMVPGCSLSGQPS